MHHDLKSWPVNFTKLQAGCTAEVRRNDRSFALKDFVTVNEFYPSPQTFSGRTLDFRIDWIHTSTETRGLEAGHVVLCYTPIVAVAEVLPPPIQRPDTTKLVFSTMGWMCDANPVMQIVEDVRGERHQLMGPEMNDAAGVGASGLLRIWEDGKREFVIRKCEHELVGMACVACGVPRSIAFT